MQRLLLVLLMTTGAISLSGCGFFNRNNDTDVVIEPTTLTEQPVQSVETADGLPTLPGEAGDDGVVAISANTPTVIARDLIQSTDPNERAIGVERTRPDPFAGLTIPLVPPQPIEVPDSPSAVAAAGNNIPSAQAAGTAPGQTVSAQGTGPQERPSLVAPQQLESSRPEIAALPPIPQPDNARAVRVSGVIQIGGQPYAIVKAPDEAERYVRPGERIAGGSVVVKRIDTRSADPRVILVENGIEVERLVTPSTAESAEETAPSNPGTTVSTIGILPELPSPAGI